MQYLPFIVITSRLLSLCVWQYIGYNNNKIYWIGVVTFYWYRDWSWRQAENEKERKELQSDRQTDSRNKKGGGEREEEVLQGRRMSVYWVYIEKERVQTKKHKGGGGEKGRKKFTHGRPRRRRRRNSSYCHRALMMDDGGSILFLVLSGGGWVHNKKKRKKSSTLGCRRPFLLMVESSGFFFFFSEELLLAWLTIATQWHIFCTSNNCTASGYSIRREIKKEPGRRRSTECVAAVLFFFFYSDVIVFFVNTSYVQYNTVRTIERDRRI